MTGVWRPLLWGVLVLVAGFLIIRNVVPYVLPFVLAVVLAILIEPAVSLLVRKAKVSRGLAVALVLFVLIGAMGTLLGLAISRLIVELFELAGSLPQYYREAIRFTEEIIRIVGEFTSTLPLPVQQLLNQQVARLYDAVEKLLTGVLDGIRGFPPFIGVLVITFIATFFVSRDKQILLEAVYRAIPSLKGGKVAHARRELIASAIGFIKAQFVLVSITTLIVITALGILGVDYALVLGLIIGLLDFLPVVGPGLIMVPWIVYSLIFGSPVFGVWLLVLYSLMVLVRQSIEPKIISDRIGVHPLLTLLSMYLGLRILGAKGIIIGPIIAVIMKAIINSGMLPGWPGGQQHVS